MAAFLKECEAAYLRFSPRVVNNTGELVAFHVLSVDVMGGVLAGV